MWNACASRRRYGEILKSVRIATVGGRRNGMNASHLNPGERVRDVHLTEDTLAVDLVDGRTIIVPLRWYPRLLNATMEQRPRWKVSGAGYGIHWPDIDEDRARKVCSA